MLTPKKVKHRKWQKGRRRGKGKETRGTEVSFGSYGLKAMADCWFSPTRPIDCFYPTSTQLMHCL